MDIYFCRYDNHRNYASYLVLDPNASASLFLNLPEDHGQGSNDTFLTLARRQYRFEPAEGWRSWLDPLSEETVRFLIRPETSTSQAVWLRVDVLDLPAKPELTWLVSLSDVTEQMTSYRDRRQFHKMITHKLRTPFISMLTGLEILIKHTDDLSRTEIGELSRDAYKWAKRHYDDIEEVLRYMNSPVLAEPGLGFNMVQFSFLITTMCADLGVENVSISGLDKLIGIRLSLSRSAMETILWEVLDNAKKFHPQQQPKIEISVIYENVDTVAILISDDGLTLSPEQLLQVWTPYYQGEKYFTGQVDGMGLGLSLVSSLVWGAGGRCRLFNRTNQSGLTLDLTLPCQKIQAIEDDG